MIAVSLITQLQNSLKYNSKWVTTMKPLEKPALREHFYGHFPFRT